MNKIITDQQLLLQAELSDCTFIKVFFIGVAWKRKTVGDLETFLINKTKQDTLN